MPAFAVERPLRMLVGTLALLWGCSSAHDRSEPRIGAGSDEQPAAGTGGGRELARAPGNQAGEFDAGSDSDRNAVMPGTICRRLAEIQCEAERVCCDSPGRDKAICLTALERSCTDDALADRVAARAEAGFDAAQAEVVFGELERLASSCDPSVAAFGESIDGLRSMFTGTIEAGGSCTPVLVFDKAQAGAGLVACRDSERQACLPSLGAWSCVPIAAQGGACFSDANCEPGLYCNNPQLSISGSQCMVRRKTGAACTFDSECQSSFCVDGACVPAERQVVYCPR